VIPGNIEYRTSIFGLRCFEWGRGPKVNITGIFVRQLKQTAIKADKKSDCISKKSFCVNESGKACNHMTNEAGASLEQMMALEAWMLNRFGILRYS